MKLQLPTPSTANNASMHLHRLYWNIKLGTMLLHLLCIHIISKIKKNGKGWGRISLLGWLGKSLGERLPDFCASGLLTFLVLIYYDAVFFLLALSHLTYTGCLIVFSETTRV